MLGFMNAQDEDVEYALAVEETAETALFHLDHQQAKGGHCKEADVKHHDQRQLLDLGARQSFD